MEENKYSHSSFVIRNKDKDYVYFMFEDSRIPAGYDLRKIIEMLDGASIWMKNSNTFTEEDFKVNNNEINN